MTQILALILAMTSIFCMPLTIMVAPTMDYFLGLVVACALSTCFAGYAISLND